MTAWILIINYTMAQEVQDNTTLIQRRQTPWGLKVGIYRFAFAGLDIATGDNFGLELRLLLLGGSINGKAYLLKKDISPYFTIGYNTVGNAGGIIGEWTNIGVGIELVNQRVFGQLACQYILSGYWDSRTKTFPELSIGLRF